MRWAGLFWVWGRGFEGNLRQASRGKVVAFESDSLLVWEHLQAIQCWGFPKAATDVGRALEGYGPATTGTGLGLAWWVSRFERGTGR